MNTPIMPDDDAGFDARATPGHRFAVGRFWRAMPSGMPRRWWMFRPFDLVARHWPIAKRRRGILVVRMDGIGDMVLFRRTLDRYAEIFGVERSDITVLGCRSWASVKDGIFAGYRVHAIDEHAFARFPLYRFKVSMWVRRLAPAVAVCDSFFRRPLMADSLVLVSGAPRQILSLPHISERTRPLFTYYLSQATDIINTGLYPTHEAVRHARFVSALAGRPIAAEPPAIAWRDGPNPASGAPYIVLNPGSNEPGRRWPIASYAAIAKRLRAAGRRVVLVGAAEEKIPSPALAALRNDTGILDLTGRTSLPELMDVMKGAAAVLSNDSGPAHLAIALGTPTVVVVGGGHFGSFFPYPEGVRPANARFVFQEMECYHCFWSCHKRKTKYDVFPCISAIDEDRVWRELDGLLARPSAPREPLHAG